MRVQSFEDVGSPYVIRLATPAVARRRVSLLIAGGDRRGLRLFYSLAGDHSAARILDFVGAAEPYPLTMSREDDPLTRLDFRKCASVSASLFAKALSSVPSRDAEGCDDLRSVA